MNKALANRIGRIECTTSEHRRLTYATTDPWEWTCRLAAWSPRYAEIVAWTLPLCPEIAPAYPRPEPPYIRADFAETVLVQHCRLALFKDKIDQWQPTEGELKSMEMFHELTTMAKGYVAATQDRPPLVVRWWGVPQEDAPTRGRWSDRRRRR